METSSPAHAAHDFVKDEQNTISIANLSDRLKITWNRRKYASRCATNGFRYESDNAIRSITEDGCLKFIGEALPIILGALVCALFTIGVAGRYMRYLHQDRCKGLTPPSITTDRKRAERIAMIALPSGDEVLTLRLTNFEIVLTRHLQSSFNRFRTSTHKVNMADALWRVRYQMRCKLFSHMGGEKTGMRKS